jgi:hypothetical protein
LLGFFCSARLPRRSVLRRSVASRLRPKDSVRSTPSACPCPLSPSGKGRASSPVTKGEGLPPLSSLKMKNTPFSSSLSEKRKIPHIMRNLGRCREGTYPLPPIPHIHPSPVAQRARGGCGTSGEPFGE